MRRLLYIVCTVAVVLGSGCSPQPEGGTTSYEPYGSDSGGSDDAAALDCAPDLDGEVAAEELEPSLGVEAKYIVSPPGETRTVDLEGEVSENGRRFWDWSKTYESDRAIGIAAQPLEDQWYADSFPEGEFALPVDLSGNTEGIYRRTSNRMLLLGIASAKESPDEGKTLYVYEEPVVVYKFPIREGASWISEGRVKNGTVEGTHPYSGTDTYEVTVRAVGKMKLPNFTFDQVHRVDTQVTVEADAASALRRRRQVSFLAECFGEVARATSETLEMGTPDVQFEEAAEVRRLGVRRGQ